LIQFDDRYEEKRCRGDFSGQSSQRLAKRFPSGKKSPSGTERDDHRAIAITLAAGPGSFVTIPGGFPILVNGRCVGAVGASGASKNDIDIAKAGIAAFERE